jgi:hypothetical protein
MSTRPVDTPMVRCRSCGARIFWATTDRGKAMPIDVEPAAEGNVRLRWSSEGTPLVTVLTNGQREEHRGELYQAHFRSCPDADRWRRR